MQHGRVIGAPGDDHLGGVCHSGACDKTLSAAGGGGDAHPGLDKAHARLRSGPDEVARQRQFEADREVQSVDHGDGGQRQLLDPLNQTQQAATELRAGRRVHHRELLRLHPGAENLAFGPQDQRAHAVRKIVEHRIVSVGDFGVNRLSAGAAHTISATSPSRSSRRSPRRMVICGAY